MIDYTLKEAATLLNRPYATVYKLCREMNIGEGKHLKVSQANMEILRERLEIMQERRPDYMSIMERLEADIAELQLVQESQKMALESINNRLEEMR